MNSFREYIEELQNENIIEELLYEEYINDESYFSFKEEIENGIDPDYLIEKRYDGMQALLHRMLQNLSQLGKRKVDQNALTKMVVELGCMIAVNVAIQTDNNKIYNEAKKISKV